MREQVQEISVRDLHSFKNHPFQVKDDDSLKALCDSIREYGILSPLLARPTDDGFEIVSGHRRKAAALRLGLDRLPVLVRDMSDDEAIILMVDSNIQRENLLPSEKAFAYKMKLEALKHQGKATSSQVGTKLRSDDLLADSVGESRMQIQRYIRLTNRLLLHREHHGSTGLRPRKSGTTFERTGRLRPAGEETPGIGAAGPALPEEHFYTGSTLNPESRFSAFWKSQKRMLNRKSRVIYYYAEKKNI